MSNIISLDGIIPYSLIKKITNSGGHNYVKSANFDNEKLIITLADNSQIIATFSEMLLHENKKILDDFSILDDDKISFKNIKLVYETDLLEYQKKEDLELNTDNKNIVPSINELLTKLNKKIDLIELEKYYTKDEINERISNLTKIIVVDELPQTGENNIIYLIKNKELYYDEYLWNETKNEFDIIGNTKINLDNFYTKSQIDNILVDYLTNNEIEERLLDYQKKEDDTLITETKQVVGAINEIYNNILDNKNKYYLKSEIDVILDNYVENAEITMYQPKNDRLLETEDKTIVGAINELNKAIKDLIIGEIGNFYYNKNEINQLLKQKLNIDIYEEEKKLWVKIDDENTSLVKTYSSEKIQQMFDVCMNFMDRIPNIYQKKRDNLLETEDKTIVGAINKLHQIQQTGGLIAGNGIDLSNSNISVKIDTNTMAFTEDGKLKTKIDVIGSEEGNPNILQVILKDVQAGQRYDILSENINHKNIVQYYKIENPRTLNEIITNFDIQDEEILEDNGIKIKNLFSLNVIDGESETINKSQFLKILKIQGGI